MIKLIQRLFPNESFPGDWYGWLTNQISHIALGMLLAAIVSGGFYLAAGEFPVKIWAWMFCAISYAILELIRPGELLDSIEDWVFVAVYGSGASLLAFTEVMPGSPELVVNMSDLPMICGAAIAHLGAGAYYRGRDA